MTHTVRSIDALISGIPEAQPIIPAASSQKAENTKVDATETNSTSNDDKTASQVPTFDEKPTKSEEKSPEIVEKTQNSQENTQKNEESGSSEAPTDEYGNPVAKPKTYTEDQVQQMIRDRLKRGQFKQEQPPTQQQVQQAQDSGFNYDENSDVPWSQQMENFVENTMVKVNQRQQRQQQEAIQRQAQVEFESKFHHGMSKYPDFVETLSDKPVSDDMMMAVRGLENPAAFLYTAAKKMPQELERIAKIRDPYIQVAEMGRLHERLSKPKGSSNAPKPLSQDRSDISERAPAKVSIDHLIAEDAKSRFRR